MKHCYQVAVTFEHEASGPATHREAFAQPVTLAYALSKALRAAKKAYPGKRWSSLVLLVSKPD